MNPSNINGNNYDNNHTTHPAPYSDVVYNPANPNLEKPKNPNHVGSNMNDLNGLNPFPITKNPNYNQLPQNSPPNNNSNANNQVQSISNQLHMMNAGKAGMMHQMRNNAANNDEGFEPISNLSEKKLRLGFIKKTFGILGTQLLITFLITLIPLVSEDVKTWMHKNWWLVIVSSVLSIIILYVVVYTKAGRKVPLNYILVGLFTIFEAYTVAFLAARFQPETVALAAGLTTILVIALSLYAACTKTDFTKCGGFLLICMVVLITGGVVAFFFRNRILNLILSCLGVLVFGIYLIFDIQLLLGNKKNKFSKDDYILAAMMLYIDIVQMFIYILQIIGGGGN